MVHLSVFLFCLFVCFHFQNYLLQAREFFRYFKHVTGLAKTDVGLNLFHIWSNFLHGINKTRKYLGSWSPVSIDNCTFLFCLLILISNMKYHLSFNIRLASGNNILRVTQVNLFSLHWLKSQLGFIWKVVNINYQETVRLSESQSNPTLATSFLAYLIFLHCCCTKSLI